jgi:hypothetical protein
MVINDLNVIRITAFPNKTDAPLLIDPDAELPFSVMMQSLKVVRRWNAQGLKNARCIEHLELDHRRPLDRLRQLGGEPSVKKLLGLLAFERLDHGNMLSLTDIIVKGY